MVVFAKEPRPGRVKTRLARGIGTVAAARWFRGTALGVIRGLARDPRWALRIAVSPDREGMASRVWPVAVARQPQGRSDLGARMARALRSPRPGPVVVIGADVPGISPARIAEAFAALGRADAVFGPAEDGGFWLVGLKRLRAPPAERRMFEGVRWSRETTLAETLDAFRGLRVAFCAELRDVDEAADLVRVEGR
ncbi:MAG: TIGR04282 family arsenosugar biosynthesis glycosyltransferase [Pseudomonadota bacterium]